MMNQLREAKKKTRRRFINYDKYEYPVIVRLRFAAFPLLLNTMSST